MVITRVGPVSCAKITGILYALLGLAIGGVFSMVSLAGGLASKRSGSGGIAAAIGVAAIFVFPVFYGAIGFLSTLIGAWVYNLLAGLVGGIEMDIQ